MVNYKFVTMRSVSTDPLTSARIIICYYGSKQRRSSRTFLKLYVRSGPLVVSMCKSRTVTVHATCRAMLIALASYRLFLRRLRWLPSVFIRKDLVLKLSRKCCQKYMNLPLTSLLQEATLSMEVIKRSILGGRIQLSFSPSAEDLLVKLTTNVCLAIDSYKTVENSGPTIH